MCERAYEPKATIPVIGNGGFGKTYSLEKYKEKVEGEKRFKCYYYNASTANTQAVCGWIVEGLGLLQRGNHWQPNDTDAWAFCASKMPWYWLTKYRPLRENSKFPLLKTWWTWPRIWLVWSFAGTPYFIDNLNRGVSRDKHLRRRQKTAVYDSYI